MSLWEKIKTVFAVKKFVETEIKEAKEHGYGKARLEDDRVLFDVTDKCHCHCRITERCHSDRGRYDHSGGR